MWNEYLQLQQVSGLGVLSFFGDILEVFALKGTEEPCYKDMRVYRSLVRCFFSQSSKRKAAFFTK